MAQLSLKGVIAKLLNESIIKSGGTMTGELKTSFHNAVAMGSFMATSQTIPNLIEEVRYSSGCMGSVSITTAYTRDSVTLPVAWYNFLYIPHRSGGQNGQANQDNCNYGNLIMFGMTTNAGMFVIRYASSAISFMKKVY